MGKIITENGNEVVRTTRHAARDIEQVSSEFDYIILNYTTSLNRRIIEDLNDRSKIIELSLAKTPMLRYRSDGVSLTLLLEAGAPPDEPKYDLILVTDVSSPVAGAATGKLFSGLDKLEKTAAEHDKMMSELLVKPYIMSLLSRKITDLDQKPATGEYEMILELSRSITNYNIDQIRDLIRNNPHTGEIFAGMEENLKRVWNELSLY